MICHYWWPQNIWILEKYWIVLTWFQLTHWQLYGSAASCNVDLNVCGLVYTSKTLFSLRISIWLVVKALPCRSLRAYIIKVWKKISTQLDLSPHQSNITMHDLSTRSVITQPYAVVFQKNANKSHKILTSYDFWPP